MPELASEKTSHTDQPRPFMHLQTLASCLTRARRSPLVKRIQTSRNYPANNFCHYFIPCGFRLNRQFDASRIANRRRGALRHVHLDFHMILSGVFFGPLFSALASLFVLCLIISLAASASLDAISSAHRLTVFPAIAITDYYLSPRYISCDFSPLKDFKRLVPERLASWILVPGTPA